MGISNNNKFMLDRPMWEQLPFAPAAGIAGTVIADDNKRYIYIYIQTSATAAQFWRYDTWYDNYQQLATPATQTGTVASMVYNRSFGRQFNGKVYGSCWLLVGNATTAYFYKYDIATNAWTAMSVANVPATIGTDVYLNYPGVCKNNYSSAYHSGVTRTITAGAAAAVGATTITVGALPEALAAGTILRFGIDNLTVTTGAVKGDVTITVSALPQGIALGAILYTTDGKELCLSANATAGATSLTVYPLKQDIKSSSIIEVEKFAVLTASAAAAATSITVSALLVSISNTNTAPYYGNMYLIGNAATQMYRYTIGDNAWSTTSANSGNPALAAITGAVGAGNALKWLPATMPDKLYCLRGAATANAYIYDLVANTWATQTYYNTTETFTTGTCVAARPIGGKQASLLIQKDATMRFYEAMPYKSTLEPSVNQWLYPTGAAVVGDRTCILTSPDGVDFLYILLHSTSAFVRCALIDS